MLIQLLQFSFSLVTYKPPSGDKEIDDDTSIQEIHSSSEEEEESDHDDYKRQLESPKVETKPNDEPPKAPIVEAPILISKLSEEEPQNATGQFCHKYNKFLGYTT